MSVKFLVVGDIHYRGDNPRARLDKYPAAILSKIQEIHSIARENKCVGILNPGDLTDSPGIGYGITGELAKELMSTPCPWYMIPGTHDSWDHNINSLHRTPMGFLNKIKVVNLVGWEEYDPMFTSTLISNGECCVEIGGRGYCVETDNSPSWYSVPPNNNKNLLTIGLYHGALVDEPLPKLAKFQLINDIVNPPDITVVCHIHNGFGAICRPDGKWFINPGALCRKTGDVTDINRTVRVALLEITENRDIRIEFIPLKSAKPGNEVLSREHIEEEKAKDERLERFLRLLNSESEQKFMEVQEIVESVAKSDNLPKDVVNEALARIGKAREIISGRG